jgi:Family of unknown function (DUF6335)
MAKRKAARRKAVTTRRKSGRTRSAGKSTRSAGKKSAAAGKRRASASRKTASAKVARRKVAKKTVRAARKSAVRKGAAKKRQVTAKAMLRRAKKAAPRKAVARKVVAPKAAARKTIAPKRVAAPRPKPDRAPVRTAPGLNRERRVVRDDDIVQTPPSTLDFDRTASAARSGRRGLKERYDEHTETSPALTGGDVDADWESAYSVGDEAPGGDNPTPDQDLVDDIGRAVGVEYQDNEELKGEAKIAKRDRNRWELDPASSDDWEER